MIHLSIQDVAMLANLASCCNSVDEFVEVARRTYGTDSSLLSGQTGPAEFVVNYESIAKISLPNSRRTFTSAYNTIKASGIAPGPRALSDLATAVYGGIYSLKYNSTSYKTYLYLSITYKYKIIKDKMYMYSTISNIDLEHIDDYRIKTLMTIGQILTEPTDLPRGYVTVGNIAMDQMDLPRGYITVGDISESQLDLPRSYITPRDITQSQVQPAVIYTAIDDLETQALRYKNMSYLTPKLVYHSNVTTQSGTGELNGQPVDTMRVYMSPRSIYHFNQYLRDSEGNVVGSPIDTPVVYNTPKSIYHSNKTIRNGRGELRGVPIDNAKLYLATNLIFHFNNTLEDSIGNIMGIPLDRPVSYNSPKLIYHSNKTQQTGDGELKGIPLDRPIVYVSPSLLFHSNKTTLDGDGNLMGVPLDRPVSYNSPKLIYHSDKTILDSGGVLRGVPIDSPVIYMSPQQLYHTRQTFVGSYDGVLRGSPVDSASNYSTISYITHSRIPGQGHDHQFRGQPVDKSISYVAPSVFKLTRDAEIGGKQLGQSVSYSTLVNYLIDRPRTLGISYMTLNTYDVFRPPSMAKTYSTVTSVRYNRGDHLSGPVGAVSYSISTTYNLKVHVPGDVLVGYVQTLSRFKRFRPGDHLIKSLHTISEVDYGRIGDHLVNYTQSVAGVMYNNPDDYKVKNIQSIGYINDYNYDAIGLHTTITNVNPGRVDDYKIKSLTSVDKTKNDIRGDRKELYTTVRDVELQPQNSRMKNVLSVDNLKLADCIRASTYTTVKSVREFNEPNCGAKFATWGDKDVGTWMNTYNKPVNIHGLSKIRITLHPHPVFNNVVFTDKDGFIRDEVTNAILPPLPTSNTLSGDGSVYTFTTDADLEIAGVTNRTPPTSPNGTEGREWTGNYPFYPGYTAISQIELVRHGNITYPLSTEGVMIDLKNCPFCGKNNPRSGYVSEVGSLSSIEDGRFDTGFTVVGEPMQMTIHLPELVDLTQLRIAPLSLSAFPAPLSPPGWVQIEGYYPGVMSYFTITFMHIPRIVSDPNPTIPVPPEYTMSLSARPDDSMISKKWEKDTFVSFDLVDGKQRGALVPRTMMYNGRETHVISPGKQFVELCPGTTFLATSAALIPDEPYWPENGSLYSVAFPPQR